MEATNLALEVFEEQELPDQRYAVSPYLLSVTIAGLSGDTAKSGHGWRFRRTCGDFSEDQVVSVRIHDVPPRPMV